MQYTTLALLSTIPLVAAEDGGIPTWEIALAAGSGSVAFILFVFAIYSYRKERRDFTDSDIEQAIPTPAVAAAKPAAAKPAAAKPAAAKPAAAKPAAAKPAAAKPAVAAAKPAAAKPAAAAAKPVAAAAKPVAAAAKPAAIKSNDRRNSAPAKLNAKGGLRATERVIDRRVAEVEEVMDTGIGVMGRLGSLASKTSHSLANVATSAVHIVRPSILDVPDDTPPPKNPPRPALVRARESGRYPTVRGAAGSRL